MASTKFELLNRKTHSTKKGNYSAVQKVASMSFRERLYRTIPFYKNQIFLIQNFIYLLLNAQK